MELNLKLNISDVYGGDGITRPYSVEDTKLSRSRKKTLTRQDVGVPVESEMSETEKELKETVCNTFAHNGDNTPVLRLGGSHGKLWGTLKECAEILKDSKGTFKSFAEIERLMRAVRIIPVYVELKNVKGMKVEILPQILAGRKSSMITQYFDVISECTAEVKLIFPDQMEKQVRAMLETLQDISCLNKRRAVIRIAE